MSRTTSREEKREAIREAAFRTFREHGYQQTSVDKICQEAGISKGSLYWHYDSKQEIFVDLVESWAHQVMTEVFSRFEDSFEHRQDFASWLMGALAHEAKRGKALVPLWMELSLMGRSEPELQKALAKVYRRVRAAIAEIMRPITPEQTDDQRRGLAAAIFGVFLGIVMQGLVDPEGAPTEVLMAGFMGVVAKWLADTGALDKLG